MSSQSTGLSRDERGGLRPLAVSARTAAELTGLSLRTIWTLIKDGKLDVARVGGRTLIKFRSLERLLDAEEEGALDIKNPRSTGSAARAIENFTDNSLTAHVSPRQPPPSPRLRRLAAELHSLGKRPLFELLAEVSQGADLWERLEHYAKLAPLADFIAAHDGDRLPPARIVGEAPVPAISDLLRQHKIDLKVTAHQDDAKRFRLEVTSFHATKASGIGRRLSDFHTDEIPF